MNDCSMLKCEHNGSLLSHPPSYGRETAAHATGERYQGDVVVAAIAGCLTEGVWERAKPMLLDLASAQDHPTRAPTRSRCMV
jgi:hypothetical protein